MGALFGECVLNRESHYIRRWRLTNTSDTIVILSLTHQTNFRLFETIFLEDLLLLRQAIQYPSIFLNINVHVLIIYYLCIELISYNTTMPVKYNHIFLDVIV